MIVLFTDFGANDIYVGQVKAGLHEHAPGVAVIDLLHEAPAFRIESSAHLLAALAPRFPAGAVFVAVVDPGVGTARYAAVVEADARWYVGPDNGLLSVVAARASTARVHRITWRPTQLAPTFHGRDLFAPIAGEIARGAFPDQKLEPRPGLDVDLGAKDLTEVIYIDHYGNAVTGLRAATLASDSRLIVHQRELSRARTFGDFPAGVPFWYENSIGLAEIAVNRASAAALMGIAIGDFVALADI